MEVLWEQGPSTVTEVRSALHDQLAYTTVLTVLRNLESKGFVTHREEGRAHRYSALVERDVAQSSAVQALKQKPFQGSAELLLTRLVADRELSDAEIKRILLICVCWILTPPILAARRRCSLNRDVSPR